MKENKLADRISRMDSDDDVHKAIESLGTVELAELSLSLYDRFLGAKGARKAAEEYENRVLMRTAIVQAEAIKRFDKKEDK